MTFVEKTARRLRENTHSCAFYVDVPEDRVFDSKEGERMAKALFAGRVSDVWVQWRTKSELELVVCWWFSEDKPVGVDELGKQWCRAVEAMVSV